MFDAPEAFRRINGQYSAAELQEKLREVMIQHYREIPVEFKIYDLFSLAAQNQWLDQLPNGQYKMYVPEADSRP